MLTCWMILVTQQAQNHQSIIMNLHAVKYSLDEWMLTDSTCLPNIHSLRWELAVGTIRVHKQEHWQSLVDTASFYVFIVHIVDSMCTSRTWSCRVKVCSTYEAKYKFMMLLSWICGKPVEWYSWANRHKTTRQLLRSCTQCEILTPQAWPQNQEAIVSRQILRVRIVVFRWKKCFWQHPTSFVRSYNVQPQRITHMSGITKFHAVNQTVFVGRKPIGVNWSSKSRHCNSLSLSNKQVQRDCR